MPISDNEKKVLARAARILERQMLTVEGDVLSSPNAVYELIKCRIGALEHECFGIIALTNRHQLIKGGIIELFRGTVDSAACYPREVVKEALKLNAAAVLLYHNHPSFQERVEPSDTDVRLTRKLVDALSLCEIRVLDHVVVSGDRHVSFAERGLM